MVNSSTTNGVKNKIILFFLLFFNHQVFASILPVILLVYGKTAVARGIYRYIKREINIMAK
jgi:hypothetical protein